MTHLRSFIVLPLAALGLFIVDLCTAASTFSLGFRSWGEVREVGGRLAPLVALAGWVVAAIEVLAARLVKRWRRRSPRRSRPRLVRQWRRRHELVSAWLGRRRGAARLAVLTATAAVAIVVGDHPIWFCWRHPSHWVLRGCSLLLLRLAVRFGSLALRGDGAPVPSHQPANPMSRVAIGGGIALGMIAALLGSRAFAVARTTVSPNPGDGAIATIRGANLLLITVDALRADHLGVHGYARPTSPFLDGLAGRGVLFERAYTAAPHTSFALTSLMLGRPAVALSHIGRLDGHLTLADRLNRSGYTTAAFVPPAIFFADGPKFDSYRKRGFGFQRFELSAFPEDRSATARTDQVLAYLDREHPPHMATWVHYFAPHEPYVEHPEDPVSQRFGPRAVDRYDGEIRWVDREIGRLVDEVRARYPRTVVVVTADHGEEFGEHGGAYHGTTLFDEQVRVPLIFSAPGQAPKRIAQPISTLDVVPMLQAVLGLDAPVDLPGSPAARRDENRGVVSENGDALRMVVADGHKLICDLRRRHCQLFDLSGDPGEVHDLATERPELAGALFDRFDDWISSVMADGRGGEGSGAGQWVEADETIARARLRDRSVAAALLEQLMSGAQTAVERRAAGRALALVADSVDPGVLSRAEAGETDTLTKAWLLVALVKRGERSAAGALQEILPQTLPVRDAGGELFSTGVLALSNGGHRPPADLIERALETTDDVESSCDLLHAAARGPRDSARRLLFQHYEPVRTRICCAEAIGHLADPLTVSFILDRLADETYAPVQLRLIAALRRIGLASVAPRLAALAPEVRDTEVGAALAEAVEFLRDQERG